MKLRDRLSRPGVLLGVVYDSVGVVCKKGGLLGFFSPIVGVRFMG